MGKASDLVDRQPNRSSSASSRTASKAYHLRFVDPANNATPLNDDDGSEFTHDSADDFAEDVAERHSSVSGKHNVAVDDLLSSPRYVDAKALKRSTQAEIERIERERHADHFASYAQAKPPERKTRRGLVWSLVISCLLIAGAGIAGFVLYPDNMSDAIASAKRSIFGSARPDANLTAEGSVDVKTDAQKPAAPVQITQAPVAPSQPQSATPVAPQVKTVPQQQAVGQAPVNNTSPLAKSLFELGALSCIARANQISKFLSDGNEAIVLQKPVGNADRSLLMATLLPTGADKKQDFSIVTLSPNQASGCDGNYQSIRVIEKPCPNAVAEMYGAAKALTAGTSGISIVPLNQFGRVFAIPAGNTCVMIKQELVQ